MQKKKKRTQRFYEIELSITEGKKIEAFIKNSLKIEQLKGDNQYACEVCDKKTDATRRLR